MSGGGTRSGRRNGGFRSQVINAVLQLEDNDKIDNVVRIGPVSSAIDPIRKRDVDARFKIPDGSKYAGIIKGINNMKIPNTIDEKTAPKKLRDYLEKYTEKITNNMNHNVLLEFAKDLGVPTRKLVSRKVVRHANDNGVDFKDTYATSSPKELKDNIATSLWHRFSVGDGFAFLSRRSLGQPIRTAYSKI